jgi:hypothetical protein
VAFVMSEGKTKSSGLQYDKSGITELHVQAEIPEYPWNRESFWN